MKKKILIAINLLVFIVPFLTLIESEKSIMFGITIQAKMTAVDYLMIIFRNNFQDINFFCLITFLSYFTVCVFMLLNIVHLFIIHISNIENENTKKKISDIPSILISVLTLIVILMPYFLLIGKEGVQLNIFGYIMFIIMALVNMVTRIYFYYTK